MSAYSTRSKTISRFSLAHLFLTLSLVSLLVGCGPAPSTPNPATNTPPQEGAATQALPATPTNSAAVLPSATPTRPASLTATTAATPELQGTDTPVPTVALGQVTPTGKWRLADHYGGTGDERFVVARETRDGGLLLAGNSDSYGAGGTDAWVVRLDQSGRTVWEKTYGFTADDSATDILETPDGDLLVAGYTVSFGAGLTDAWVLRLDSRGEVRWQMSYGGPQNENVFAILPTGEDGFILAGETGSSTSGGSDAWVLALDGDGALLWEQAYGGDQDDRASAIHPTQDGGWLLAGSTASAGAGGEDLWLLALDERGNALWERTYGGGEDDWAYSLQATGDGAFLVAGSTASFGAGEADAWVLKVAPDGDVIWQKAYGGAENDYADSAWETEDGQLVLAGETESFGLGARDIWVMQLRASGDIVWQKTFGGEEMDYVDFIQPTQEGGYILAGWSASFTAGDADGLILELDSQGGATACQATLDSFGVATDTAVTPREARATGQETAAVAAQTWVVPQESESGSAGVCSPLAAYMPTATPLPTPTRTPASPGATATAPPPMETWAYAYPFSAQPGSFHASLANPTRDGGYIVMGWTGSFNAHDLWLVKLAADGSPVWAKIYGDRTGNEDGTAILETSDGGFVVAGGKNKNLWVLKLDQAGEVLWASTYDGGDDDFDATILETGEGGFLLAGASRSFRGGDSSLWLLRLDDSGAVLWSKAFGGPGQWWTKPGIRAIPDEGFLVWGELSGNRFSFFEIDIDGNVLQQHTYLNESDEDIFFRTVTPLQDGGFLIAGGALGDPTIYYFWRVNPDASLAWRVQFLLTDLASFSTTQALETAQGFVIAGSLSLDTDPSPASTVHSPASTWIIALSDTGELLWQRHYRQDEEFRVRSLQASPEGGFVLSGTTICAGSSCPLVMHLDHRGEIPGCDLMDSGSIRLQDISEHAYSVNADLVTLPQEARARQSDALAASPSGELDPQPITLCYSAP